MKRQRDDPKLPVVMYGNLTAREHAIVLAHRWQLAHPEGNQNDAYTVITELLMLLPYKDVQAAIAKGETQP